MRIFASPTEAFKEVERDLWEMGISVHPQTMQDLIVEDDPDFVTKEIRGYGFQITNWKWSLVREINALRTLHPDEEAFKLQQYIMAEFEDRVADTPSNPGHSFKYRPEVWNQFLHDGLFGYTYSERIHPQLSLIISELRTNPETRQAIITIHTNIAPLGRRGECPPRIARDLANRGGGGRVPCSMYYQMMIREGKLDLIYTMRSCDFLIHFAVDICLALRLQEKIAVELGKETGTFTYFVGSLHAYTKDMKKRGIF